MAYTVKIDEQKKKLIISAEIDLSQEDVSHFELGEMVGESLKTLKNYTEKGESTKK